MCLAHHSLHCSALQIPVALISDYSVRCIFIPAVFYSQYAPRPHVTVCIYTPLLVGSVFTDEGSRRLPKRLICL